MSNEIIIANKRIGAGFPVFIVAELSANHNQDFETARKSIEAIKKAGADAVKLQTYTPDTLTIDCQNDYFTVSGGTSWDGLTLYDLYRKAYTPWEWQPELKQYAESLGLVFFSTPFDQSAVDFLEKLNVPAYKIASFEIKDIPLIEYIASKGKPVIISTGIASLRDIYRVVRACRRKNNNRIILLKCTSSYPARIEDSNLRTLDDMSKRFRTFVGLSDHTIGLTVSLAATALGSKVIEKHFILNRNMGGPDSAFSSEPIEFRSMVDGIRQVERCLGGVNYSTGWEQKYRQFARSLFVIKDIQQNERFSIENVRSIRPGYGMYPRLLSKIIGKRAATDIKRGTPLAKKHIRGFLFKSITLR